MTEKVRCPIWGTPAIKIPPTISYDGYWIDSPRTGGEFSIHRRAQITLRQRNDECLKAKLTSWLIEQRRLSVEMPEISEATINEAEKIREMSVFERADQALKYIYNQTPQIGDFVVILTNQTELFEVTTSLNAGDTPIDNEKHHYCNALKIQAFSESTNLKEVGFLLDYLHSQKWIDYDKVRSTGICRLTVEGYARLAELDKKETDSSKAFVAMWLDSTMNDLWEKGIAPAIRDAGYDPIRIDKIEPIDKIDDAIIAEIRRSRLIVADFTHGDEGARGSVYYEAGYAHGMNIEVIFLCREDITNKIHFDTRQHKHIEWEEGKLGELREKLANRIASVVGDGPKKNTAR